MKKVRGVGINDLAIAGNEKIYHIWSGMLQRCYDKNYQIRNPSYMGCSVCKEWLKFSNFKTWVLTQEWEGKQLDKDIINPSNKVYSPDTCFFVDQNVNTLLTHSKATRGKYPIGVDFKKSYGKFRARVGRFGGKYFEKYFDKSNQASKWYNKTKSEIICDIALRQTDLRATLGLVKHAKRYLRGEVA